MIKKIFTILSIIGLMLPAFVFAAYGLEGASQGTGLINADKSPVEQISVPTLIGNIIGVILSFLGAIFFLLILYAGIIWMTAFGSSEKADKAKGILEQAAIGLLIVLAAYAISRFVFSNLPGVEVPPTATTQPAAPVVCANIQNAVECNNQPDPVTSVPRCRWVGELVGGACENNI